MRAHMKFNNKAISNILKRNLYHDDCFATQYLKLIYTNPVIHFNHIIAKCSTLVLPECPRNNKYSRFHSDTVEVENGLYTTTNLQDCS